VSVSLFDVMLDWLGYFPHLWWRRGVLPERTGMRHPHFCPYGPFRARDGKLVGLAVLSAAHWRALCEDVLDRKDLLADSRFSTNEGRVALRAQLEATLEEELAARSAKDWLERLEAARVPCGAVNDLRDVMEHPQLAHNGLVVEVESPVGSIPTIGNPFLVDGRRPALGPVPALGEHG
jgi:itaconate CoA-transferase